MNRPDWFRDLTGFPETAADVRRHLDVSGGTLRSRVNGRTYGIGVLETPSVADLRARAMQHVQALAGTLTLSEIVADVGELHRHPASHGALFQVASQFNLLEMTSPAITPEAGVTRYASDRTQGPACAMAAGAATIYRNYFHPVHGAPGQTADRQIDCLRDIGDALGNTGDALWTMRNGYALCSEDGLARIDRHLSSLDAAGLNALRDKLRVGVHWDVEVTAAEPSGITVSQAFCSALPVGYVPIPAAAFASFATLVLEGAYEATMWAAAINAARTGHRVVFLTRVGGGAFGNEADWIHHAIDRACRLARGLALDVRLVSRLISV